MSRDRLRSLYAMQLNSILEKKRQKEMEQDEAERNRYYEMRNNWDKANAALSILSAAKDFRSKSLSEKRKLTYGDPSFIGGGKNAVLFENKRYQDKHDPNWLERIFAPLEETEGYKKFKLEQTSDLEFEKGLQDLENLEAPEVKGSGTVTSDQMMASAATGTDAPMDPQLDEGFTIGKTYNTLKNVQDMVNIGKTITSEDSTGEEKSLASVQALKMLADQSVKKAKQESLSQIGSRALRSGAEESLKLTGKQATSAVLGGALGGYTMVTEGKEAKESWEEGDYDEAILQGIGSVSGGLQMAGSGMMATGVGAPLGAVLYGIGSAGSVISGAGQLLENLFDKPKKATEKVEKPKFDATRYLNSIRNR